VTIGSLNEPVKAALLDLKTKNPGADNVTVESDKGGGLVFPRVKLKDVNTLEPFIPTNSPEWTTEIDNTKKVHTGMMVYNLETGNGFSPGIYVWNGSKWIRNAIDANNGLTKTGNNIKLGGTLNNNTQITQGNNSLTFTGSGKIYMKNVKNNVPVTTNKIATMGIDVNDGELFVMKSGTEDNATTKAITYVVYQLSGEGDWVANFDTRINAQKYTLVVVGSTFSTQDPDGGIKPGTRLTPETTPINYVYADRYKNASLQDRWFIHADYADSAPSDGSHGIWTINCMIINNSLVNVFPNTISVGTGGMNDIEASGIPAGL
jgi:hypothetical protein